VVPRHFKRPIKQKRDNANSSSNKMSDIFSDIDVSGFPDDALPDHQKYEHPLVQR